MVQRSSACLALAALAVVLVTDHAFAVDDQPAESVRCECVCETANMSAVRIYDSVGYGCSALWNKTCNAENPATGLIETGRTAMCSQTQADTRSGPWSGVLTHPGVLQPLGGN
ncbi:MAG: hypothetical protein R3F55_21820 [Alphaproteobacteria bacterium]